jgi:limonene-1,2-epoxide hydrolase
LSTTLESVRCFAEALDAEDYDRARAALADDCIYHAPEGVRTGPDAIIGSYRTNAASARQRFERIEYASAVEVTGPSAAVITFIDRLKLGGAWHQFSCRQRIRVGAGAIEEIWHEEIPGERERLQQFEEGAS